jgi:hypothetical protein
MESPEPPDGTRGSDRPESPAAGSGPLRRVEAVAYLMDDAFGVPGTDVRFGLDPVMGILPVAGDGVAALFSLYIVVEAAVAGVPPATLARMLAIVAVDTVVGSVPLLGPVFDAVWKANVWNVATLERHLAEAGPDGD